MRINFLKKTCGVAAMLMLSGYAPLTLAQDKPADNMQILRDKIKADKKLVVAANMELTESEDKAFWPTYDAYQKDLQKINQRIAALLDSYADDGLATIALWHDVTPTGRDSLAAARTFGDGLIAKTLDDVLASDGAYREGVLYAGWIVRVAAPYFGARRRFDGVDLAADPRLGRMIEWLCYELAPDGSGRTNGLNDSSWSSRPLALHNTVLEWAQMRWGNPLARYFHDHVVGPYGHDFGVYADRLATALWAQPIAAIDPSTVLPSGRFDQLKAAPGVRAGRAPGGLA